MALTDAVIARALADENYLSASAIEEARARAKRQKRPFIDFILEEGVLTRDLLGQAIAELFGVPYSHLSSHPPAPENLNRLPGDIATRFRYLFMEEKDGTVTLATDDPKRAVPAEIKKIFAAAKKIACAYALPQELSDALRAYDKKSKLSSNFLAILTEKRGGAPEALDEIFRDALSYHASDIHLEPQEQHVLIRFRIDGVLQELGSFPKDSYENILNRIKVQAHLRTDEHFSAQDGSLRQPIGDTTINLRISIIPTLDGEKVVMRLLTEYVRGFTLSDLGLSERHQKMLLEAANKPFGMILVVGPTGSGKTTTLYALLKHLHQPDINITTIEDPVEYKIPGVNHIQVNTQTNLTFAKGLRSIVRQDPDIIFLGEIRDTESAEIAVNAALTGHLLLSTFHANDAATAIPRLLDMGIERFLLSSTLQLVIAQSLVRRICEQCRVSTTESDPALQKLLKNATLYRGKGCASCAQTGYRGRVAIYEFIRNTPSLQELILKNPSTKEVWDLARSEGALSLFEDGVEKVKAGLTTMEEVVRVAAPPTKNYYG